MEKNPPKKEKTFKEKALDRKKELARGNSNNYFIIKDGKTLIRMMFTGEREPGVELLQFFNKDTSKYLLSPSSLGLPCKTMEAYERLKNSPDPDDKEIAKLSPPKRKYALLCLMYKDGDVKQLDLETGPRFVLMTKGLYQNLTDYVLEDDGEYGPYDPNTGYPVLIKREGQLLNTEYTMIPKEKYAGPLPKKFMAAMDPQNEALKLIPTFEETVDYAESLFGVEDKSTDKKKKKATSK